MIIIPSKNIYGTLDNNKVVNNQIKSVSANVKQYGIDVEALWAEESNTVPSEEDLNKNIRNTTIFIVGSSNSNPQMDAGWGYRVETFYTLFNLRIPKDLTLNKPRYFKITLQGKKKTGTVTLDVPSKDERTDRNEILMETWSDKEAPFSYYSISSEEDFTSNPDENNGQLTIPTIKEYHGEVTALAPTDPDVYFPQDENGIPIYREFRIIDSTETVITVGGYCLVKTAKFIKQSSGGLFPPAKNEAEIYVAEKVTISLYGEKLEEIGSVVINTGTAEVSNFALPENELVQNTTNSRNLASSVETSYKDGKETATILCSISDYYDTGGKKVISISGDKMSFHLHDEVIPYVFGADGKDKPMSVYADGSPKVFQVLKSKIYYDGAVWQELTLQEKK